MLAIALSACRVRPQSVRPTPSDKDFSKLDCAQLADETRKLEAQMRVLYFETWGVKDPEPERVTRVGVAAKSDVRVKDRRGAVAELKGEAGALDYASVSKNCAFPALRYPTKPHHKYHISYDGSS